MRWKQRYSWFKDTYIDAHCIEMDVKEYKQTIN